MRSWTFRSRRLWVVGSYARGAMTCGDIDLVMELDGRWHDAKPFFQQMLKSPRRTSLYIGTPEENSSHASFPEARLVWEAGQDWRVLLEAIKVDASASRFDRPTDRIPFRLSQLPHCSLSWAESAIAGQERGELDWRYVTLDELTEDAAKLEGTKEYQALAELARGEGVGEKSRMLLPYLAAYAQRYCEANREWHFETLTQVRKGRTLFALNTTPGLEALNMPGVSTIVTMPHLNARGPNGLWVVTRGPQHSLVRAFEGCEAWVLANKHSNPVVDLLNGEVELMDVYRSEAEALSAIKRFPRHRRKNYLARHLKDAAFQEIIDGCHVLDGELCMTVFTDEGEARALSTLSSDQLVRLTVEELANLFRPEADGTLPAIPESAYFAETKEMHANWFVTGGAAV